MPIPESGCTLIPQDDLPPPGFVPDPKSSLGAPNAAAGDPPPPGFVPDRQQPSAAPAQRPYPSVYGNARVAALRGVAEFQLTKRIPEAFASPPTELEHPVYWQRKIAEELKARNGRPLDEDDVHQIQASAVENAQKAFDERTARDLKFMLDTAGIHDPNYYDPKAGVGAPGDHPIGTSAFSEVPYATARSAGKATMEIGTDLMGAASGVAGSIYENIPGAHSQSQWNGQPNNSELEAKYARAWEDWWHSRGEAFDKLMPPPTAEQDNPYGITSVASAAGSMAPAYVGGAAGGARGIAAVFALQGGGAAHRMLYEMAKNAKDENGGRRFTDGEAEIIALSGGTIAGAINANLAKISPLRRLFETAPEARPIAIRLAMSAVEGGESGGIAAATQEFMPYLATLKPADQDQIIQSIKHVGLGVYHGGAVGGLSGLAPHPAPSDVSEAQQRGDIVNWGDKVDRYEKMPRLQAKMGQQPDFSPVQETPPAPQTPPGNQPPPQTPPSGPAPTPAPSTPPAPAPAKPQLDLDAVATGAEDPAVARWYMEAISKYPKGKEMALDASKLRKAVESGEFPPPPTPRPDVIAKVKQHDEEVKAGRRSKRSTFEDYEPGGRFNNGGTNDQENGQGVSGNERRGQAAEQGQSLPGRGEAPTGNGGVVQEESTEGSLSQGLIRSDEPKPAAKGGRSAMERMQNEVGVKASDEAPTAPARPKTELSDERFDAAKKLIDESGRDGNIGFLRKNGFSYEEASAVMKRLAKPEVKASDIDKLPKAAPAENKAGVREVPIDDLSVDAKRFQFKSGTDKEGASDLLKGVKQFDRNKAGVVLVWRDAADGKLYIVNGHHRFELARRLGEKTIDVRQIEAKDAAEARLIGAENNIAEGRGSAIDAAKVFKESGKTPEELAKSGMSLKEGKVREGLALSKLTKRLFDMVVSGDINEKRGVAIGEAFADPQKQEALFEQIQRAEKRGKSVSPGMIREIADFVNSSSEVTKTTSTLFGDETKIENLAIEKARVSDWVKRQINRDSRLFGPLAKAANKAVLEQAGNKIDSEASKAIADNAELAKFLFDKLKTKSGEVSDLLNDAAKKIDEGTALDKATENLYPAIRDAIQRHAADPFGNAGGESKPESKGPSGGNEGPRNLFSRIGQRMIDQAWENLTRGNKLYSIEGVVGDAVTLATGYILKGAGALSDIASKLLNQFGEAIRPHLQHIWDEANKKAEAIQGRGQWSPEAIRQSVAQALMEERRGRPDLSQPTTLSGNRAVGDANDAAIVDRGLPQRTKDVDVMNDAVQLFEHEPNKVRDLLMRKAATGGQLNDLQTAAAAKIVASDAMEAIKSGSDDAWLKSFESQVAWRTTGTTQARGMRQRYAAIKDPAERIKVIFAEDVMQPRPSEEKALLSPDTSEAKKKEIAKKVIDRSQKVVDRLKKAGIDIGNITAADLSNKENVLMVSKAINEARAREVGLVHSVWDALYEWRLIAMLSDPKTNVVNIGSNIASAAWDLMIQRQAEKLTNLAVRDKTGARFGEEYYMLKSLGPAIVDALRAGWLTLKYELPAGPDGVDLFTQFDGKDARPRGPKIPGVAGRILRLTSLTPLLAADQFVKSFNARVQVAGEAYSRAKAKGLKGEALEKFITEQSGDLGSESWDAAMKRARVNAFQQELGPVAKGVERFAQQTPVMRHLIMFVKTSTNIFKTGFRKSPLGSTSLLYQAMKVGWNRAVGDGTYNPQISLNQRVAEQAMAWGGLFAAAAMRQSADEDDGHGFTFTGPSRVAASRGQREATERGRPSMSIRIGGRWFKYERIEPVATTLGTVAAMLERYDEAKRTGRPMAAADQFKEQMKNMVFDKTFLRSLGDILDAWRERNEMGHVATQYAVNFGISWVPNFIKAPLRAADPMVRSYSVRGGDQTYYQEAMKKAGQRALPAESIAPTPRVDPWGEDIKKGSWGNPASDFFYRLFVPAEIRPVATDKMDRVIYNWNLAHPDKEKSLNPPSPYFKLRQHWTAMSQEELDREPESFGYKPSAGEATLNEEEYYWYMKAIGKVAAAKLKWRYFNVEKPSERDADRVVQQLIESRAPFRSRMRRALELKEMGNREGYEMLFNSIKDFAQSMEGETVRE
jgi:ParB-like chromosome segregation protein Spo0J